MSGFLDRMAQRATGTEPHWRTRPRSRFEPTPAMAVGRAPVLLDGTGAQAAPPGSEAPAGADRRGLRGGRGRDDDLRVAAPREPADVAPPPPGIDVARTPGAPPGPSSGPGGADRPGSDGSGPGADRTATDARPSAAIHPGPSRPSPSGHHTPGDPPSGGPADVRPDGRPGPPTGGATAGTSAASADRRTPPAPVPPAPSRLPGPPDVPHRTRAAEAASARAGRRTSASRPVPAAGAASALPDVRSLVEEHVVPALRRQGVLAAGEGVDARLDGDPSSPPHRTSVVVRAVQDAGSPGAPAQDAQVHVHIGAVQVVRPAPAPQTPHPADPGADRLATFLAGRRAGR